MASIFVQVINTLIVADTTVNEFVTTCNRLNDPNISFVGNQLNDNSIGGLASNAFIAWQQFKIARQALIDADLMSNPDWITIYDSLGVQRERLGRNVPAMYAYFNCFQISLG